MLIALHTQPVYITEQQAKDIRSAANARFLTFIAGLDSPTAGDLCIKIVLEMIRNSGYNFSEDYITNTE